VIATGVPSTHRGVQRKSMVVEAAVAAVLVADEVLAVLAVVVELAAVVTLVLDVAPVAVGTLCRHLAPLGTINAFSGASIINRYRVLSTWKNTFFPSKT